MTSSSAEDQHAPSTGQVGVVVTEIASGHGNLTAWANELVSAAVELARKHRLALVGGETRIITAQPESDFDHYFNATRRLNSEVDSLRQQLAAAQAERDEASKRATWYENGVTWETTCLKCAETIDKSFYQFLDWERQRDQLRAQVEELRQRACNYEIAEGTAIAQRNAALNEALAYKAVVAAAREYTGSWGPDRSPARLTSGLVAFTRMAAALAALDAASAGQPATPSNRPQIAQSANDSPTQAQPEVRTAGPSESLPRTHPEAPGE